jgi:hypothetical protein
MPRPRPQRPSPALPSFPAFPDRRSSGRRGVLGQVAASVDAALADSPPGDTMALFLTGPPGRAGDDGATLGWFDLEGRDPLHALLGFVAPEAWWAMGLHCSGRATALDPPAGASGGPDAIRLTTFVDRSGGAGGVLRRPAGVEALDEPPSGVLGDCLRRALGVATPTPPPTSVAWWVSVWLDRVVRALLGGAPGPAVPPRSWDEAAALHPVAAALVGGRGADPAQLAAATREVSRRWPWARLRTGAGPVLAGVGALSPDDRLDTLPTPAVAAWMDDGMFARWCAGALPDLLDACAHLLPPGTWARLEATVEATLATGDDLDGAEPPASVAGPAASPPGPSSGSSGPSRGCSR